MPPRPSSAPNPEGLLASILEAPDRDRVPGTRPVVSCRVDDEPEYLDELDRLADLRVTLERRGVYHGEWARLRLRQEAEARSAHGDWFRRWHESRPIVLPGFADPAPFAPELAERRRLQDELREPGGLRAFLGAARERLEPDFAVHHRPPRPSGDPRDVERVMIHAASPHGRLKDLWAKSAWLSDRDDDASLRLRLSFGREVEDDASRDLQRHLAVGELAARLFPESALASEHPWLSDQLPRFVGGPVFLTQHIAYWNAPGGGALFHHDAFDEPEEGGQRGVLYLQLTGRTGWLALSIEDLARRVAELGDYLEEGELSWVRARLFPGPGDFERFRRRTGRFRNLVKILGRPACGELAELVNQGPEFTSLLADAGHAFVLEPGDAILLPNHGLARTTMHSVFCIGEESGYALSMAIRELEPPLPEPEPAAAEASRSGPRPAHAPPRKGEDEGARPAGGPRRRSRRGSARGQGRGRGRRGR